MKNVVVEFGVMAKVEIGECSHDDFGILMNSLGKYIESENDIRKIEIEHYQNNEKNDIAGIIVQQVADNFINMCDNAAKKEAIDETGDNTSEEQKVEEKSEKDCSKETKEHNPKNIISKEPAKRVDNLFKGFKKTSTEKVIMPEKYLMFNNCEKCGQVFGVITDYPYAQCKCGNELFHDAELVKGDIKCNCGKHLNFYAPKDIGKIKCGSCKVEIDVIVEDGIVLRKKR